MIGRERRVLLRHYLEQGMDKTAIARDLGISRRTVYHWIETGQLDRELDDERVGYGPRRRMPSKLDAYKALIDARLEEYPKLTAVRVFGEVRAAGYTGGYCQVKRYARQVRPRPPENPVVRFETAPGHQGQVDFAHFRLPWGTRYALLVVLGYSRLMWIQFFERQTMQVLMRGLESSFSYFGGVPKELLFDQMKAVVLSDGRGDDGPLVENSEFVRYAHHWGFRIRACRPYRAQTKGKVERPIRYLRESFFYGRTFTSDDDLNTQVLHWLDTQANVRIHGTLKERPVDRFERERLLLEALAPRPYRSLVLPPDRYDPQARRIRPPVPTIHVERRPLATYAQIAGGVR
jgi:transposase